MIHFTGTHMSFYIGSTKLGNCMLLNYLTDTQSCKLCPNRSLVTRLKSIDYLMVSREAMAHSCYLLRVCVLITAQKQVKCHRGSLRKWSHF